MLDLVVFQLNFKLPKKLNCKNAEFLPWASFKTLPCRGSKAYVSINLCMDRWLLRQKRKK